MASSSLPGRANDRLHTLAKDLLDVAEGYCCGYVTLSAFVDRSTGTPTMSARLYRVNKTGTVATFPDFELRENM